MNAGRVRINAFTVLPFLLAALAVAQVRTPGQGAGQERPPENIYFTLKNAGDFKTLIKAVEAAGMVDTLKGSGPFTMFAPTDAAFAKLPADELENLFKPENKETLKAILAYHVLPEKVMSAELAALREAKTLKRTKLKIDTGGGLKIDGAAIVRQDIVTSNGVIHVIDTLLKPN